MGEIHRMSENEPPNPHVSVKRPLASLSFVQRHRFDFQNSNFCYTLSFVRFREFKTSYKVEDRLNLCTSQVPI